MKFLAPIAVAASLAVAHKSKGKHVHTKVKHAVASKRVDVQRTIGAPMCPDGYVYNGELCESPIHIAPEIMCHEGLLRDNRCVIEEPMEARCRPGYSRATDETCTRPILEERLPMCPPEYSETEHGCEMRVPAPVSPVCNSGILEGPVCAVRYPVPPIVDRFCPDGYLEEEYGCWRSETFDCSPEEIVFPIPVMPIAKQGHGHGHGGHAGHGHKRYLKGKKSYAGHAHGHIKQPKVPVVYEYAEPERVAVIAKTCERKIGAPMEEMRTCPERSIDDGHSCVRLEEYPPVMQCSIPGMPAEDCYSVSSAPYIYQCAEEFMNNGFQCVSEEEIPVDYLCPHTSVLLGDACVRFENPFPDCDPGYVLAGGSCTRMDYEEPTFIITSTCVGAACAPAPLPPPPPPPVVVEIPRPSPVYKTHKVKGHGHAHGKY